jgi:arabinofuranosyltransferase
MLAPPTDTGNMSCKESLIGKEHPGMLEKIGAVVATLQQDRATSYSALLALIWGLMAAVTAAWVCDDAFISYRYARNLLEGFGLVFNAGERVEGYTNFLWTVWLTLGLACGYSAEGWSQFWGLTCYIGAVFLLIVYHLRLRQYIPAGQLALPIAALGAAFHLDWNIYATSGLETSLYTFLLLAGYLLLTVSACHPRHLVASGVIFGLATLTRPDGILFVSFGGLFVFLTTKPRFRHGLLYGASFAAVWLPFALWRLWYYEDLFPNTYYAKSAYLTWYTQGWTYAVLYFHKYWALLLAPLCLLGIVWRARGWQEKSRQEHHLLPQTLLAAAFALLYTFYIIRIGGDFMYARMLVPTVPFYLILLELGWLPLSRVQPLSQIGLTALLCLSFLLMPVPVTDTKWIKGISNEWMYYVSKKHETTDRQAAILKRYFADLPVRVAFFGAEARLVYHAEIPLAIESETGLTDRFIARQTLPQRRRIGHEKHAPVSYLIDQRQVHFLFHLGGPLLLRLDQFIPTSEIVLDGLHGRILHWDPSLMAELKQRGAVFTDFPIQLDAYIARLDTVPAAEISKHYPKLKRFYFDHVDDPYREAVFLKHLANR